MVRPGRILRGRALDSRPRSIRLLLLAVLLLPAFLSRVVIRARVVGRSMRPTLEEGDYVLGLRISHNAIPPWPALRRALLPRGAVVLVRPPAHLGRLEVKRIDGLPGDVRAWGGAATRGARPLATDQVFLLGDAGRQGGAGTGRPADSRLYGPCPVTAIVARVALRYRPLGRTGLVGVRLSPPRPRGGDDLVE